MRAIILLLLAATALPAQQDATTTLTLGAKLVTVPAVVRDKHGALLTSLTRESFVLQVDGHPQPIRYFDHDLDLPLTLGLLIDTSMSQVAILDDERDASRLFLDKMLAPADQAFVMQFDKHVLLLQDLTAARPPLDAALAKVDAPHPDFSRAAGADNRFQRMKAARGAVMAVVGTKLFDAVYQSTNDITAKQTGRRALILLTDGGDHGSVQTLDSAIEAAQRADTVVYAIYYAVDPSENRQMLRDEIKNPPAKNFVSSDSGVLFEEAGKKILDRITTETGGKVFEVTNKLTVAAIYGKIAEELRAQYRIGFTPSADTATPGYHRIQVTITGPEAKPKHTIQTRDGYYAAKSK